MIKTLARLLILTVSVWPTFSEASEKSLETQCARLSAQIEKLDKLRRQGGSGRQMDKWRSKRHQLSDKAYHLKCHHFGVRR